MRWVALFGSSPRMPQVRAQHEAQHLAYLRAHGDEIVMAGGLRDGPDEAFAGGLWVLAPMPRERAVQLVEGDPYFVHGARPYRLMQWGDAFLALAAAPAAPAA